MPNTGKPSPACHLCRKRRVKCDLNPAGCLRCAKLEVACPGYRREQDLLFHNQDKRSFASTLAGARRKKLGLSSHVSGDAEEGSTARLWSPGSNSPSSSSSSSSSSLSTRRFSQTSLNASDISPTIPAQIAEQWNIYSIPIVLRQFSAPADDWRFYGYLDFLPDLYCESNEDSCLYLATTAVAKSYITNLSLAAPDQKEIVRIYGRALRATNAALADPLERVKDTTIIAVWLLGIHELVVNSPKTGPRMAPEAYHMHSEGIASLIRVRGPYQFTTRRGRNIFWMMHLFIQTHCMVVNKESPPQSLSWFELLRHHLSEDDQVIFAVSNYNYRLCLLFPKILHFIKTSPADDRQSAFEFASLLASIDTLQAEIQTWNAESAFLPGDLASLHFRNTLLAGLLKLQRFVFLLVSHMLRHSHNALPFPDLILRQQQCLESIQLLASEILTTVPVALGDVESAANGNIGCWADGLRLLWPLRAVSLVPGVFRWQQEESQQALQLIGRQMGIRFALDRDPPTARFKTDALPPD